MMSIKKPEDAEAILRVSLDSGKTIEEFGNIEDMKRLYARITKAIKNKDNETIEFHDGKVQSCIVVKSINYIEMINQTIIK